jgi:hypothetical protein
MVRYGGAMPTITAATQIDYENFYEVDGAIREGVVEDAVWRRGNRERRLWLLDGRLHRLDGPAFIAVESGFRQWYREGELHREDGAAVIRPDGAREYWIEGMQEFWMLPEALWSIPSLRERLRYPVNPRLARCHLARYIEWQRRKALRLISRPRAPIPMSVLQASVAEALGSPDPELRRWGQSLMAVLARRSASSG